MLDIPNSLLAMTVLFNAGLAFFVIRGNWGKPSNMFFGIFSGALSLWSLVLIGYYLSDAEPAAIVYGKLAYGIALIVGAALYLFSYSFPEEKWPPSKIIGATSITVGFFLCALLIPGFLAHEVLFTQSGREVFLGTPEYIVFAAIFLYFYFSGFFRMVSKYLVSDGIIRLQLYTICLSVAITGLGGVYFNLFLASPFTNDFTYLWTGPLFSTALGVMIMYSVFHFRIFNTKVVFTELLISLLWVFTLLRTLLAGNPDERVLNGGLFLLALIIGSLLIRSVRKEVEQREQMEKLATQLGFANERLKELDQLKNEFLSIASHQLRAPITAIRGYASLMLEGEYGQASEKMQEPIQRIADSSRNMVNAIEDYLNVSRIEQGRMKYEKSKFDLADLARKTVEEMKPVAQRRDLNLKVEVSDDVYINADVGKIKQVISNLIDNAIKYTETGTIRVVVSESENKARLMVEDTGMGIPREEIAGLFEKFTRARDANKVNTTGTGLGLYVAKQLVEGHEGKIWAESDGPGRGSRFIVELPF